MLEVKLILLKFFSTFFKLIGSTKLGIEVKQGLFQPETLWNADSAFYCGTAAEVIGIESVDDKKFPKDWNDSLGKKIQEEYSQLVRETATTFSAK